MHRLKLFICSILYISCLGLVHYELTAKSPGILGARLPAWWATDRAEHQTRWHPLTGVLPLDKLLHESEEAVRFYGILVRSTGRAAGSYRR
jgi:hypothetical protein